MEMSQMEERFSHPIVEEDSVLTETGVESVDAKVLVTSGLSPKSNVEKGERVLELCIEQGKVLCVKGYIDSQVERGGDCREVVLRMKEFVDRELGSKQDRRCRGILRELQVYLVDALAVESKAN